MKRAILFLLAGVCIATSAIAAARGILNRAESAEAVRWADSVYNALTERERVAQLIFPKANPTQGAVSKSVIKRLVADCGVGGLMFTEGNLEQYVEMTNYVRSISKVPVMMAFDGEWGLAMRISDAPRFPANMGLGAIRDTALLERYGREVGRQLRLIGQNVDFAPVVDVNSNPRNPVIGYRSFGEDPDRVASLSVAMSRGMEAAGVQAVAKHFPGHGDTSTDSHKEKVTVAHSLETLECVDLLPFRKFINSGLSGVMVGHIIVPPVDASGRPASLSEKATGFLLRGKMGFKGLVYTDDLDMKGASFGGLNSVVEALKAGADVLLCSGHPKENINAIMAEINAGRIGWNVIEDHCKRILRYKFALGLLDEKPIDINVISSEINSTKTRIVQDALACAAITVLRNDGNILPVGNLSKNRIAVVNIGAKVGNDFASLCRKYANVDVYATLREPFSRRMLDKIRSHDVVIAAVYADSLYCRNIYSQLSGIPGLVGVFMMNPYKMNKFRPYYTDTDAIVLAYENLPSLRQAAAMALFGGIRVDGRLPVNLPGFPIGSGIVLLKSRLGYSSPLAEGMLPSLCDSIDSIVDAAIDMGAVPGCQVLVARNGNVVIEKAYGTTTKGGPEVDTYTLYDLASVSKATGTLPGIMKAYDLGLFDLDRPAADYIPGLQSARKTFTPRQMLYHETGMPAAINVYELMMDTSTYSGKLFATRRDARHGIYVMRDSWGNNDAEIRRDITSADSAARFLFEAARGLWVGPATVDTIMNAIYNQKLRPTIAYNYSCLNFCLLLDMEQRLTGQPHERWVTDSIFAPLGLYNTFYRPALHVPLERIAPTENDTFLRRQLVHGYVHDETAAMQGGVSGNAGLFANAGDIAKLCQMWLQGGSYGDVRVLSPETVGLFMTSKSPTCRRGLGFDKPDADPAKSPTCEEASPSVVGHTGFTGTVFWIDPDENLIFVFLTNRVNPTRDNPAFAQANLRPGIFSQIYRSLHPAE